MTTDPRKGAGRHALVYWFPAVMDPPKGAPAGRQWSMCAALSRHTDVVILNPRSSRFRRPATRQVTESLWIVDQALPYSPTPRRRALRQLQRQAAWNAVRRTGHDSWTLWLSANDPDQIPPELPSSRLVFDVIDPPFVEAAAEYTVEKQIARRAGTTFVTAAVLEERLCDDARHIVRIPNGCDDLGPLAPLGSSNPPRVGYLGTVDWRFDVERVAQAATHLPDLQFVIGGRINADQASRVEALLGPCPNVELLGTVPYEAGKSLIESFDVGLIPFREGPMGDAINPVKMYSYLERGVGVVASDIRECRGLEPHVRAASGSAFAEAIRAAVGERSAATQQAHRALALANTWDRRAEDALSALTSAGVTW